MNSLTRNAPVAYVIGAAGFIGSHLTQTLLDKGIQVIGVDDLSTGSLSNLSEVTSNQNFHFIQPVSGSWSLPELPRLDYALFLVADDISKPQYLRTLENFISHLKPFTPKILLGSDLGLYEKNHSLSNLALAEKQLAEMAGDKKTNIRVVRLAGVWGPRMHFRRDDPLFRLIKSAALEKVRETDASLDFGTRDLNIYDAINLLVKALLHGGTAHKIYDGALLYPLKVAELKQVLIDPLWHEKMAFEPTKLPAWPSPNLEKTETELSFKPKIGVVNALKETLHFFRSHPEYLKAEVDSAEKVGETEAVKDEVESQEPVKTEVKSIKPSKFWNSFLKLLVLGLVVFGLVVPFATTVYSGLRAQSYLDQALESLVLGEIDEAKRHSESGLAEILSLEGRLTSLKLFGKGDTTVFEPVSRYLSLSKVITLGVKDLADGTDFYLESFKSLTGESEVEVKVLSAQAKTSLDLANQKFGLVDSSLAELDTSKSSFLNSYYRGLKQDSSQGLSLTQRYSNLVLFTSQLTSSSQSQSYLVALVSGDSLRPGFGQVSSIAQVDIEKGRIKKLETYSAQELTQTLIGRFQAPKDFSKELKGFDLGIEDVALEASFTGSAQNLIKFYQQSKGVKASGVIVLDSFGLAKLLQTLGPVEGASKEEALSKVVLKGVLDKLLFGSSKSLPQVIASLEEPLETKHLMVYASDPILASFLDSENLSGGFPKAVKGEREEFLGVVEFVTLGKYSGIKRSWEFESTIDKNLLVKNKLTLTYTNQNVGSLSDYKSRLRVYLPLTTTVSKILWGEREITKTATQISDYGKAGYIVEIDLPQKSEKALVLEYSGNSPLLFEGNASTVSYNFFKQPGTLTEPFNLKVKYPASLKLTSPENQKTDGVVVVGSTTQTNQQFKLSLQKK